MWLLTEGLSFLPQEPLHRAARNVATGFLRVSDEGERQTDGGREGREEGSQSLL